MLSLGGPSSLHVDQDLLGLLDLQVRSKGLHGLQPREELDAGHQVFVADGITGAVGGFIGGEDEPAFVVKVFDIPDEVFHREPQDIQCVVEPPNTSGTRNSGPHDKYATKGATTRQSPDERIAALRRVISGANPTRTLTAPLVRPSEGMKVCSLELRGCVASPIRTRAEGASA